MRASNFSNYTMAVCATGALLTGCGGSQKPVPTAPNGIAAERTARNPAAREPLLYVAHTVGFASHSYSVISIRSMRHHREIAKITGYGYVTGLCADASGNVWAPNYRKGRWQVDEFAHGGTTAIAELKPPHGWELFSGCAVDPSGGDLAVLGLGRLGTSLAIIWSDASGTPAKHRVPFPGLHAAYDNAGNLFISGWEGGSDYIFVFGELAKGEKAGSQITLDKKTYHPGAVQWDGTDVIVGTTLSRRYRTYSVIYRVKVSGTTGTVVGVVRLQSKYDPSSLFLLRGRNIIARSGDLVRDWPYPAGGKPTRSIARYARIAALAISL